MEFLRNNVPCHPAVFPVVSAYLFHYLFIAMASYYLTMYAENLPVPVIYLCVAAAGFVGAYLAYTIISRIPVLRWLICGMGGKKKDVCR